MDRKSTALKVSEIRRRFGVDIEFPEYQREPDVWSKDQKQRLIDSILRRFDISSVYFYERDDAALECIDGRQRINAIMSFFGTNASDEDNGFPLKLANEIAEEAPTAFHPLVGLTFEEIRAHSDRVGSDRREVAQTAISAIEDYEITTVMLSGARSEDEFNLQFLRLNLGTLINAGEKLNAMVGSMRDLVFESDRVGKHPFFDYVRIPTRRYAKESTAAQVLIEIFSLSESQDFARARHMDLQRFFKRYAEITPDDPTLIRFAETLDAISEGAEVAAAYLRNRAVTVSLVALAYERNVPQDLSAQDFWSFATAFLRRLQWQVAKMKTYNIDEEYPHLVEFQRHLTQASVEKPAIKRRHEILSESLDQWRVDQRLVGDAAYHQRTGNWPA